MIRLTDTIPNLELLNAEAIKIKCLYDSYKNDDSVMFWLQNDTNAVISMTDGNMIIYNINADTEELKGFVEVLAPVCIFSDYNTLEQIGRLPEERINIMYTECDIEGVTETDRVSSKEIYELLNVDGLSLPEYPYFAVDFCRRLNKGNADFFALKEKCAVVAFKTENFAIINGIASHQKGYGGVALKAIIQKNKGRKLLVCCRDKVKGFYEKNGFKPLYHSGYWVKNK